MPALLPLSLQTILHPGTGKPLPGAIIEVFKGGTLVAAPVYVDATLTVPHPMPPARILTNGAGMVPALWVGEGTFRLRGSLPGGQQLFDVDGIPGAAQASSGGTGGGTTDRFWKTGRVFWEPDNEPIDGTVSLNGGTIGSAASGATTRANDDTEQLYKRLWNRYPNTICPVVGGRGASADADWAAKKQLTLLDMRGVNATGLDTMGNVAANRIQRSTTITTTKDGVFATAGSLSGLTRGMTVTSANVQAGTVISAINPTTGVITLSKAASASGANVAARFSQVGDAQLPGSRGGAAEVHQVEAEVGTHAHGVNDPGHAHPFAGGTNTVDGTRAKVQNGNTVSMITSSATTGISIVNAGSGLPMNNVPPSMVGTWYQIL